MREFKLIGEKIDAAVSYFAGLEEMFTWQKDIFLKKLNADFEVLIHTLEKKRNELQGKIMATYNSHIDKSQNFQEGLSALKATIEDLKNVEAKVDIDYIFLNRVLTQRIKDINKHMALQIKGNELDLLSSCFVNDPQYSIERSLSKLDFFPISQQRLTDLTNMFQGSKIIKPEHITVNFLTQIMPRNFQWMTLLYQHTTESQNARKEIKRWEQLQRQAKQQNLRKGDKALPQPTSGERIAADNPSGPTSGDPEPSQFNAPVRFHEKCDN